jgi:signal transduction histidine kinase
MRQLFQNLLSNALKFHRKDVPPIVRVSCKPIHMPSLDTAGVEIRISDNGIGFDEKYLDRIFTIFQRLHGRFEYEGTGIGLDVVRKIVDRHEGLVTAEAKLGEGSTFIINLPLKQKSGVDYESEK